MFKFHDFVIGMSEFVHADQPIMFVQTTCLCENEEASQGDTLAWRRDIHQCILHYWYSYVYMYYYIYMCTSIHKMYVATANYMLYEA